MPLQFRSACVWRQIDITGPCNRARVDIDSSEEIDVEQRSKRARQIFAVSPHTTL